MMHIPPPLPRHRLLSKTLRNSMSAVWVTAVGHCHLAVVGLSLFSPLAVASGQVRLADQPVATISREVLEWSRVAATDATDSLLVLMTEEEPVLHLFGITDGAHLASWGRTGEGPGEFQSSAGVALVGDRIYALDTTQRRLAVFAQTGMHIETILLDDNPFPFADKLYRASGDTVLIGTFEPMGTGYAVIAWTADGVARTVLEYQDRTANGSVRLEAPNAPSLTLPGPFGARPNWTADASSGRLLYWPGHGQDIQVVDLDGNAGDPITLFVDDRFEVTAQDQEHWFATGIPSDFRGQRVFEPLRRVARDIVEFPNDHPLFYEMMAGSGNAVWIRRTPSGRRQAVWDVASGQRTSRVVLPEDHRLLTLYRNYVVMLKTDDANPIAVEVRLLMM